ncbi:transposase [Atopobium sp. oral taxon 416]|nr:transposase [Atopobium sp. oral taxon 416]
MERAHPLASSCTLAPALKVLLCLSGVGFRCAFTFCAKMCDFSRLCSGRKATSWLGLSPSQSSSAASHRMAGISKCGPRLLRALLMGCAWACARARPTFSKRCPASVDLHIRERARLLSEEAVAREGRLTLQG